MENEILIAPSMLASNFLRLEEDVELVNKSEADWFHLDVMDGNFVPNISFGFPIIEAIASKAQKPLDVHLMIEKPERYTRDFVKAGANLISVQAEACTHLHRTIQEIKNEGVMAGVVLNPHTPVDMVRHVLSDLDLVLIMSVNPGFGGQSFIPESVKKIDQLRKMIDELNPKCYLEVDGGVGPKNAQSLVDAGANVLVAGSAIFGSQDPIATIKDLKNIKRGQKLA